MMAQITMIEMLGVHDGTDNEFMMAQITMIEMLGVHDGTDNHD
jgi:hypothetical protein